MVRTTDHHGVNELAGIGKKRTVDRLLQDLGVEERLDALVDKYLSGRS
jgi:hypothetical protein